MSHDNREQLIGGFAFFIPAGTSVDAQVVSSTIKPDIVPPSNWTDYSLGDVLNFKFGQEKEDASYMAPRTSGGYQKITREFVTQDFLTLKTRQMGELVHRLQMGLLNKIAINTPQTPGLVLDRHVDGWLRIQARQLSGIDRFVMDWWCECRVEETAEFSNKVIEPVLRFTLISGVAGNSTNFTA